MLALINRDRSGAGVIPMVLRDDVTAIAQDFASQMAAKGTIWHNDAYFTSATRQALSAAALGENVALAASVDVAHQRLMNSPGHRANLLDGRFSVVGLGLVEGSDGRVYVVQNFLQPSGQPVPTAGPKAASASRPATPSTGSGSTPTTASRARATPPQTPSQSSPAALSEPAETTAPSTPTAPAAPTGPEKSDIVVVAPDLDLKDQVAADRLPQLSGDARPEDQPVGKAAVGALALLAAVIGLGGAVARRPHE